MFGLTHKDIADIIAVLRTYPEIEETVIFGSRAIGTHKKGSDIDLAIKGDELTHRIISRLISQLDEELTIPYFFDIIEYNK